MFFSHLHNVFLVALNRFHHRTSPLLLRHISVQHRHTKRHAFQAAGANALRPAVQELPY